MYLHPQYNARLNWYVRDAQGNVMAVYQSHYKSDWTLDSLTLKEHHMYGSSRLGIINRNHNMDSLKANAVSASLIGNTYLHNTQRGYKLFELSNHLGNVLVTISDRKAGVDSTSDGNIDYYTADVVNANDYYPFGMMMPERKYSAFEVYRYGFNGKENDNEVKGEGNQQDYGMRFYDPRLGRFLSVDPLQDEYPELTSYQFASNDPIRNIDLDGLEGSDYSGKITNATPGQRLNHPVWSFFRDLSADVLNLTPIGAGDELVNNWNKSNTTEKVQLSLNFLTSDFTPFGGPSLPSGKLHIEPSSPKTPLKGTVKPANEQPTQGTAVTNTNKQVTQANSKNTGAANSNSAELSSERISSKPLQVGPYSAMKKQNAKTGLSNDHIPSFASQKKMMESDLGRPLTTTEENKLRNDALTFAVKTNLHQSTSQTFGWKNTEAKIAADAANPLKAIRDNVNAYRSSLLKAGYTGTEIDHVIKTLSQPYIKK